MKSIWFIVFMFSSLQSYCQTELLEKLDTVDFGTANYHIMQKHDFSVYKVYTKENDSLILLNTNTLNYNDSTVTSTLYDYKNGKIKTQKSTHSWIPIDLKQHSPDSVLNSPTSDSTIFIYDELGRLIQKIVVYPYSINKVKTESYFGYLDSTYYLTFEIRKSSNLNRYQVNTTIINYEYDVKPCLNEDGSILCYVRRKYVYESDRKSTLNLMEEVYINEYGLLKESHSYDINDSSVVHHYYHYE
ncbi:hypothetical protein K6119_10620 [Paracrocinitomix mangrovi]|uniref:hypothetical protein n=1 Tax=Paracrocinitomix mangrovi TaxID=2862509 RepID=UPI001EDBD1DE|nr:hypothetical protein [Paracrocinitomix mangrovi]UKN00185.1 hypothetical protein K6119_10620 [Paracrocinitomix mangrovi]